MRRAWADCRTNTDDDRSSWSLLGSVIAWTLFGVAGELGGLIGATNGLVVLFFARAVAGAMGGNIATANAYMADITPPENRGRTSCP